MNQSAFSRKIIYIVCIGLLLAPISMVSRPASISPVQGTGDSGGELAKLRTEYRLAQDQLSQIDPASETMKLALLGLRGLAVNILWEQANEHKKKERWENLESTLNMLVKVQPNFIKVWDYQSHNLAYNVSAEFDDYEHRFYWVKRGIKFLTEGIAYNMRDHRIQDRLGFITGMKIGNADEKDQFRRMFRKDAEFTNNLANFIEPNSYMLKDRGFDNWKMAYQWYDQSQRMVEQGETKYSTDFLFYMRRPSQLRNMALGLQNDFRSDETIRVVWSQAFEEWLEYGRTRLEAGTIEKITLEGIAEAEEKLERLRQQLDAIVPNVRNDLTKIFQRELDVPETHRIALDLPSDQRTEEQQLMVREFEQRLAQQNSQIDSEIASRAPPDRLMEARQIRDQIIQVLTVISVIDRNQGNSNYRYWRTLTRIQAEEESVLANQKIFDALQLQRQSIFDDEYAVDLKTKEKRVVKQGALSNYLESFDVWSDLMTKYPILQFGKLSDDIMFWMKDYHRVLKVTGQKWPKDHPLQWVIDSRKELEDDGLPTSEEVAEMYYSDDDDN
ncbi:MAG: hypothetical protein KF851_00295 [Pirellulaceae bacterium]|nr:hypothetical protein [Pirellulaceae bacterium]